jgi:ankyrin repeat protein
MVQLLLDYGADMGSFRHDKKRHRRAQRNPMRSIVEAVEDGQGALAQACRQGVPDVVVQLLDHGADADLIPLLVRWTWSV